MSWFGCCSVCIAAAPSSIDVALDLSSASAPGPAPASPAASSADPATPAAASSLKEGGSATKSPVSPLPYKKCKSVRIDEGIGSPKDLEDESPTADGGTGSDPGVGRDRRSLSCLRSRSKNIADESHGGEPELASREAASSYNLRWESQQFFADRGQTVVVFDWDDTLFPTWYLADHLHLDMSRPLEKQSIKSLPKHRVGLVRGRLRQCEAKAAAALRKATELSHVVVVTLASSGWITMACESFYTSVGKLLQELDIPIIYAQEREQGMQQAYNKAEFQSNEDLERYWGLVKGQAIAEEVAKFYTQYEGQSWKNILSIGDSCFERYGLLAASSAYMQGKRLIVSPNGTSVWKPDEEGCWEKVVNGHKTKVRAKCCKLVGEPDVDELTLELEMVDKWLQGMVELDEGFDMDLEALESEEQAAQIEAVLRREIPVSELPRPQRHR